MEDGGIPAASFGEHLQNALNIAVTQSGKTDELLAKVNELQSQIQDASKGGLSKQEAKQYVKLLKLYREALESSERELTLYMRANHAVGRLADSNQEKREGTSFSSQMINIMIDARFRRSLLQLRVIHSHIKVVDRFIRILCQRVTRNTTATSAFFLDSNGDSRFKRKAAVIGSLDIPLPRWDGKGQPPPLCGCVPAQPDYVIPPGHQVAACTSSGGLEGTVWILATVIRYDSAGVTYEVEDIMEEEVVDDPTGGKIKRHLLPRASVLPLPLLEPPPECGPFLYYPIGAEVLALFPQTTCFYPGKIVAVPSKKRNSYLVEFVDDEDTDGSIPQRIVPQRYVLPLRR